MALSVFHDSFMVNCVNSFFFPKCNFFDQIINLSRDFYTIHLFSRMNHLFPQAIPSQDLFTYTIYFSWFVYSQTWTPPPPIHSFLYHFCVIYVSFLILTAAIHYCVYSIVSRRSKHNLIWPPTRNNFPDKFNSSSSVLRFSSRFIIRVCSIDYVIPLQDTRWRRCKQSRSLSYTLDM